MRAAAYLTELPERLVIDLLEEVCEISAECGGGAIEGQRRGPWCVKHESQAGAARCLLSFGSGGVTNECVCCSGGCHGAVTEGETGVAA